MASELNIHAVYLQILQFYFPAVLIHTYCDSIHFKDFEVLSVSS
jgi:hypothetical protein